MRSVAPIKDNLPQRFLADVRQAYLGEQRPTFDALDLITIAQDWPLRMEMIRELDQINDEGLRRLIIEYLDEVANSLADISSRTGAAVDLVDRAGYPVATMVAGAGVAAIVTHGIATVPIILIGFGFLCIGMVSVVRHLLKRQDVETAAAARDIRNLASKLRSSK